jgi:predicted transcriptional regulator
MDRSGLIAETIDSLHAEGFEAYFSEGLRQYFDIIAVGDFKLFLKVLVNIDNFGESEALELKRFSQAFGAQSFVIGERAGMDKLKDDVVFHRHGHPCVNITTFTKILSGEAVSRFTRRGQLLVGIDGDILRGMREKRGVSQEELARVLDCSGQAVYRMEKHNRVQEALLDRLLDYFGKDIEIGAVEIKEPAGNARIEISDPIKKKIVKEYFRLKLGNTAFETPIDFALKEKPLLTPVSRSEAELRSKHRIAKGLEEALDCRILHITKERRPRRLSCISFEELHGITSKDEVFERGD